MKDPRDIEERLAEGRKDYQKIPVPEEARVRVETGIMRAKAEKEEQIGKGTERGHEKPEKQEAGGKKNMKTNQKKIIIFRIAAAVAAAAAVLVILPNTGAGSGFESYKFYTIDKKTGKQIQLGDLFQEDSDYNERLSENIKDQMRAKMKEDENSFYWVDYEDVPEWNFERLKDDQNFYFDEAGNIVISFDEYEVAPGYMGASEFTVELEVFEDILK